MVFVIGFLIAVAVGLTGIGGGSFTVPCLVLLLGLAPKTAVGTAFIFAGVLRLIVGPFYLWGKQVRGAYVWRLLLGAVPGLLIGTYVLRVLSADLGNPVIVIVLGVLLAASSSLTFVRRLHKPEFARKNGHWLPWFALPIGIESGFSSAGAGALGTVLLLNYSEMTPSEVVGTDILFGFARRTPVRKLKSAIALIAILAGLQLVWTGGRSLATASAARHAASQQAAARASQPGTTRRIIQPDTKDLRTAGIEFRQSQREKASAY
jgi:hypothetical protein